MVSIQGVENAAAHEASIVVALDEFHRYPTPECRYGARHAIEGYVDTLRDARLPPERIVIAIKALTRRAGVALSVDPALQPTLADQDLFVREFVTCAIIRCFARPRPAHPAVAESARPADPGPLQPSVRG